MVKAENNHLDLGGLCIHGNRPGNCGSCPQAEEIIPAETKNGLPVITAVDFERLNNTDTRIAGDDTADTFNFQGYVRVGDERGMVYVDTLATNGILKSGDHLGIEIHTSGISSGGDVASDTVAKSPKDVRKYVTSIKIPGDLLKEKGLINSEHHTSFEPVENYEKDQRDDGKDEAAINEAIERAYAEGASIELDGFNTDIDSDPDARKKVEFIHNEIVRFIRAGGSLNEINELIGELQTELKDVTAADLENLKRVYR
ncbi:MAG: hypothetical protein AAB431_03840 [Patescibacteria group bacterium]